MERFISKVQVSCQTIKDNSSQLPYDKGLETIGAVGSAVVGGCTYKSYKYKSIKNKIEMCSYAEQLRRDVEANKMSKLRAQRPSALENFI